jgi:hypothetical protein
VGVSFEMVADVDAATLSGTGSVNVKTTRVPTKKNG